MTEQLRDIILNDHFGGEIPPQIVDQWLQALSPNNPSPLPPNVKGFYGCSLRPSMPIELARGSYKYITHETVDKVKIKHYARRMLVSLDLINVESLEKTEPTLAALALWHRALAEVRLEAEAEGLKKTLEKYKRARGKSPLPENKLPGMERLAESLRGVARSLENDQGLKVIDVLEGETSTEPA